jgi:hypothetical protein
MKKAPQGLGDLEKLREEGMKRVRWSFLRPGEVFVPYT